jgi:hypothetical protein
MYFDEIFESVPSLKCGVLINWKPSLLKVPDFEDSLGVTDFPQLDLEYFVQEPQLFHNVYPTNLSS